MKEFDISQFKHYAGQVGEKTQHVVMLWADQDDSPVKFYFHGTLPGLSLLKQQLEFEMIMLQMAPHRTPSTPPTQPIAEVKPLHPVPAPDDGGCA